MMVVKRRGLTILEVTVAGVLLAAAATLVARVLATTAGVRREAQRREWALQEASNLLERITAKPWDSVTLETAAAEGLSEETGRTLPDGTVEVNVIEVPQPLPGKRITVVVRWKKGAGEAASSVRLSTWMYRRGSAP